MNWYKEIKLAAYNFFDYGAWLTPEAEIITVKDHHLDTINDYLHERDLDYEDVFALNYIRLILFDPDFLSVQGLRLSSLSGLQKSILKSMFIQKKRENPNAKMFLEFNDYTGALDTVRDFDGAFNYIITSV